MKKQTFYQILSMMLFVMLGLVQVSAQYEQIQPPVQGDIFDVAGRLTGYIRPAVLAIFLGVSIYSGITIQTSAGEPEKQQKGWAKGKHENDLAG